MFRKIGTLILVVAIIGCGGESSKDSEGGGDKKQTARNAPEDKTNPDDNSKPANRAGDDKSSGGGRIDGVFTAGKNMQDMNKFKQVAIAMHNHHDVFRMFPTASNKARVKRNENLSWRVSLLPFAELAGEFDKFDREQPWDSEKNKPLADGRGKDQFKLTNGNLICTIKHKDQPGGLRDIIDGSSNTVMLMENPNAKGDQWTQPVDLTVEEAVKIVKSLKKGEFVLAAFYDGSALKLYSTEGRNIPDEDIAAFFGYRDGKVINDELLRPGK